LPPGGVVRPGTTYRALLDLFRQHGETVVVVKDSEALVGTISYRDLFKPFGRICLFALTTELETAAIDLLQAFPQCFESLNERRQKTAREAFNKHYGDHPTFKKIKENPSAWSVVEANDLDWIYLLASTTLHDKGEMIAKSKLLLEQSKSQIDRVTRRAERIRNWCAHPNGLEGAKFPWIPDPEIEPENFGKFLSGAIELLDAMKAYRATDNMFSPRAYEPE